MGSAGARAALAHGGADPGRGHGLPLAGFLAGFASSTAAVAGFGHRAKEERAHVPAAAAGAQFANLGSLALFAGVVGTRPSPSLLGLAAPALAASGAALLLVALAGALRCKPLQNLPEDGKARAFRLSQAFLLVGLMALVLVASALLQRSSAAWVR